MPERKTGMPGAGNGRSDQVGRIDHPQLPAYLVDDPDGGQRIFVTIDGRLPAALFDEVQELGHFVVILVPLRRTGQVLRFRSCLL